jgi:hypothetical protein
MMRPEGSLFKSDSHHWGDFTRMESQQTHVGVGMGYRDRFERRL